MTSKVGAFAVDTARNPVVRMQTQRIGLASFDLRAPVTAGELHLHPTSSELTLALDLARVRVANPLMQAAARALVGTGDNSRLRFDSAGAPDDLMRFEGHARAGDVVVPMAVVAVVEDLSLTLTGWARFTDVHIPLPGLSRVTTVEVDVSAQLALVRT